MNPSTDRRAALVVAGMHRSGTSAMARVLAFAGGSLPERVINPGPDNPLGFWEPWEMVALSDEILGDIGSAWDDVFVHRADARAWERRDAFLSRAETLIDQNYADRLLPVIKDPRSSVLTRLWRQALETRSLAPVYVIMVRHPLEVAGSLAARDGFPMQKGLLLWAAYMLATERDTRGHPRVFVGYEALLEDWRGVLDRIERVLGAPLPGRATGASDIDRFLSRSHRHHQADDGDLARIGGPVIDAVYTWMQAAVADPSLDTAAIDAAGAQMDRMADLIAPILEDERRLSDRRLAAQANAIADCEARLLREGGRVSEIVGAEADRRAVLTLELATITEQSQAHAATARSTDAAMRALRLETTALKTTVSRLLDERAKADRDAEAARHRIVALEDDLAAQTAEHERLRREADHRIEALKASVSWKITRPIRVVQSRLKRRPTS